MKDVLSLLLAFVFLQTQAWALSGGPVFNNSRTSFVGTYAGVLIPTSTEESDEDVIDLDNDGDPTTGGGNTVDGEGESTSSSIGLFSLTQPDVGVATGALVLFLDGAAFNCTLTGIIDPDTGLLRGVIDGTSTFNVVFFVPSTTIVDGNPVTTFTREEFPVSATGNIEARVIPLAAGFNLGVTNTASPSRVAGTASIDVFFLIGEDGTPNVDRSGSYEVDGFKQSDDTSGTTTFNFGQNFQL